MKYKNIELIADKDSSAELLIHIWISENTDDDIDDDILEYVDYELCINLQQHIRGCGWDVDVSRETEHLITVRMKNGIDFNRKGVDCLINHLYKEVTSFISKANMDDLAVKIGVHVDGPGEAFCFFDKDGNWYNEDSVTPEEFLLNIEY